MKRMNNEVRHDKLVFNLEDRLKASGWNTKTHQEYRSYRLNGEMDLSATQGKYRIFVEVKCNGKYKNNAKRQLRRIRDYFFPSSRRDWYFYAHYNNFVDDDYTIKRVKIN